MKFPTYRACIGIDRRHPSTSKFGTLVKAASHIVAAGNPHGTGVTFYNRTVINSPDKYGHSLGIERRPVPLDTAQKSRTASHSFRRRYGRDFIYGRKGRFNVKLMCLAID